MRFPLSVSTGSAFADSPIAWLVWAVLALLFIELPLGIVGMFHRWVFTHATPARLFAFVVSFVLGMVASVGISSQLLFADSLKSIVMLSLVVVSASYGAAVLGFCVQVYLVAADKIDPKDEILHRIIGHRDSFRPLPQQDVRQRFETPIERGLTTEIRHRPSEGVEHLDTTTSPLDLPLIYSGVYPESVPLITPKVEPPLHKPVRTHGRRSSGAAPI